MLHTILADKGVCKIVKTNKQTKTHQETEICMVRTCHTPRQPLPNHHFGHLGDGRCRGRQRKCWMDNIKQWAFLPMPDLLTRASCIKYWRRISAESSLISPRRPNRSRDWTEHNGWPHTDFVYRMRAHFELHCFINPLSPPPRILHSVDRKPDSVETDRKGSWRTARESNDSC